MTLSIAFAGGAAAQVDGRPDGEDGGGDDISLFSICLYVYTYVCMTLAIPTRGLTRRYICYVYICTICPYIDGPCTSTAGGAAAPSD